jgi:hypothetical protein
MTDGRQVALRTLAVLLPYSTAGVMVAGVYRDIAGVYARVTPNVTGGGHVAGEECSVTAHRHAYQTKPYGNIFCTARAYGE